MIPTKQQFDEAMKIMAVRKSLREKFVANRIAEGVDELSAQKEYSTLTSERLARHHEKILLTGGFASVPVLADQDGNVVAYMTVMMDTRNGRSKYWRVLPQFEKKYKKYIIAGNKSYDLFKWNLNVKSAMAPVVIGVKSGKVKYSINEAEIEELY